MLGYLSILAVVVIVLGLIVTFKTGKDQQGTPNGEVSKTRTRYKLFLNPVMIAYLLFPVLVVLGFILIYMMGGF